MSRRYHGGMSDRVIGLSRNALIVAIAFVTAAFLAGGVEGGGTAVGSLVLLAYVVMWFGALTDLVFLLRRYDEPRGAIDVIWALAILLWAPVAGLAWFLLGRRARIRQLESARRGPNEPIRPDDSIWV